MQNDIITNNETVVEEIENTAVENDANQHKQHYYETKRIPEYNDIYEKSTHVKKNNDFHEFITKYDLTSFPIQSMVDFFSDVPDFINPIRTLATCIRTNSEYLNVAGLTIDIFFDGKPSGQLKNQEILLKLVPMAARTKYSQTFMNNVDKYSEYIKNQLAMSIAIQERTLFLEKIINNRDIQAKGKNINMATLRKDLLKIIAEFPLHYKKNACFLMNGITQSKILNAEDSSKKIIFKEDNSIWNYPIYTIPEIKDDIMLFANLKYGCIVGEMEGLQLQKTPDYENPAMLSLSLPVYSGCVITCPDAFECIIIK